MKVKIKRIDKDLPLPTYETKGSVAVDLYARIRTEAAPHSLVLVPTNIIVVSPPGHAFIVTPRSSTPKKKGLSIPHGIGIVDTDYCGPDDEVLLQFYNFKDKTVVIERGERVGQGFFIPIDKIEWEEVDSVDSPTRGGLGYAYK
jgi:dUTP pyrophosphatase